MDTKFTILQSSYSSFGRLERHNDPERIQEWLKANGFDESVCKTLHGYNGADLLALTKADVKELLGAKYGIRLYNRIQYQGQSSKPKAEQFLFSAPGTPLKKRQACRVGQCSLDAVVQCSAASCGKRLCMKHTYKFILTSALYCESCAEQQTFFSFGQASTNLVEYCVIC